MKMKSATALVIAGTIALCPVVLSACGAKPLAALGALVGRQSHSVAVAVRPHLQAGQLRTQALPRRFQASDINRVEVYVLDANGALAASASIPGSGLGVTVAVVNLAPGQAYTFLCRALDLGGTPISDDLRSRADIPVQDGGALEPLSLQVTLLDTPFSALASGSLSVSPGNRISARAIGFSVHGRQAPDPAVEYPSQMATVQAELATLPPPPASADIAVEASRVLDAIQTKAPEILQAYGIDPAVASSEMAAAAASGIQPLDLSSVTDRSSLLAALDPGGASGGGFGVQSLFRRAGYTVQSDFPKSARPFYDASFPKNRFPWPVRAKQSDTTWECSAAVLGFAWAAQNYRDDGAAQAMYDSIATGNGLRTDGEKALYALGVWPEKFLRMARGVSGFERAYLADHQTRAELESLVSRGKLPIVMMSNGNSIGDGAHYAAAVAWDDSTIVFNNSLAGTASYFSLTWPQFEEAWSMAYITGPLYATALAALASSRSHWLNPPLSIAEMTTALTILGIISLMPRNFILVPNPSYSLPSLAVEISPVGDRAVTRAYPVQFTAKARFSNGVEDLYGVNWSLGNSDSFTVDGSGIVSVFSNPGGAARTSVFAKSVRDPSISAWTNIHADVATVSIAQSSLYLPDPSAGLFANATVILENGAPDPAGVTWSTSDPSSFAVESSGYVRTLLGPGSWASAWLVATSVTNPGVEAGIPIANYHTAISPSTLTWYGKPWLKLAALPGYRIPDGTYSIGVSTGFGSPGGFFSVWGLRSGSAAGSLLWRQWYDILGGYDPDEVRTPDGNAPVDFTPEWSGSNAIHVTQLGYFEGSATFSVTNFD